MSKIKDDGFSLVEVLVAVAIMSGLAMGVSTVIYNFLSAQKTNASRAALNRFANIVGDKLSSSAICTAAFQNQNVPMTQTTTSAGAPVTINFVTAGVPQLGNITTNSVQTYFPNIAFTNIAFINGVQFPNYNDGTRIWRMMQVDLNVSAVATQSGAGANPNLGLPLNSRIIGSYVLQLRGATVYACLNQAEYREMVCASQGLIYNPQGIVSVGGTTGNPDSMGCVDPNAYEGPSSNPIVTHPRRVSPYYPATPPKSYSDRRLKSVIGRYGAGLREALSGDARTMTFIRALQKQQSQIEDLRRSLNCQAAGLECAE